jgi:Bacterial type III secretion protein (HrpB1_HrpK)
MGKRFGVDLRISRLMLLIGLMCERLKRYEDGERILRAMQAYRADLPQPGTGLALCYISQGRLVEALKEIDAVRAAHPEYQMAKVLLGIAHRDAGKPGWRGLLQEVIDDGRDEYAIKLARDTLGLDPGTTTIASESEGAPVGVPRAQRVYA